MPPKATATIGGVHQVVGGVIGGVSQVVRDTCEQCGEKGSTRPYNTSNGKVIYCCDECYGYGTDNTYIPSQSDSSENESNDAKSESDKDPTDDDDDVDDDD